MKKTKEIIMLLIIFMICVLASNSAKAFSSAIEIDKKAIQFGKVQEDANRNATGSMVIDESKAGSNYKLYYQVVAFPNADYEKYLNSSGMTAEQQYTLIPEYVKENWTESTDKKFTINRRNTGSISKWVVWGKIVSSDNKEYYNFQVYTVGGISSDDEDEANEDNNSSNNTPEASSQDSNASNNTSAKTTITDGNGENLSKGNITTANTKIPQTGEKYFIGILAFSSIIAFVIIYRKLRKLKF